MNLEDAPIEMKNFVKGISAKAEDAVREMPFRCLHPNCPAMPVGCHSQQRNGALSAIANAVGMVVIPSKDAKGSARRMLDGEKRTRGCYLEHIAKATKFKGFCQKHDSALFAPIEKRQLVVDDTEQVLAFQCRAVALELRGCLELLAGFHMEKYLLGQRNFYSKSLEKEIFWAEERLRSVMFYDWNPLWRDNPINQFHYAWRVLPRKLSVSLASVITPDVDDSLYLGYKKNLVASGIDITPRLGFTLTIVPEDGLTHVIMIWPIIYDAIVQPYRDCLLSSNNFKVEKLLNKCVFCLSENWCMNPDAWEGLPQSVKDDLQQKLSMESYSDRARSVHRILTL